MDIEGVIYCVSICVSSVNYLFDKLVVLDVSAFLSLVDRMWTNDLDLLKYDLLC